MEKKPVRHYDLFAVGAIMSASLVAGAIVGFQKDDRPKLTAPFAVETNRHARAEFTDGSEGKIPRGSRLTVICLGNNALRVQVESGVNSGKYTELLPNSLEVVPANSGSDHSSEQMAFMNTVSTLQPSDNLPRCEDATLAAHQ